jgi:prephenate dehydratase
MLSPKRINVSGSEKIKIGYLGSDCSFTCRAAKRFFSQNERDITWESISSCRAIFQHISAGDLCYGVVPIESSSHGMLMRFAYSFHHYL